MTIKVAFATKESTKYACEHWHYAHKIPAGNLFSVGVWENKHFLGVVIFSHGGTDHIGCPYNLTEYQCVELTRVALRNHDGVFVSQILPKAIKYFKKYNPHVILIVSYSDPAQGHKGGIYQATNWIYVGRGVKDKAYILNGRRIHSRGISAFCLQRRKIWHAWKGTRLQFLQKYWDKNMKMKITPPKHKYLMPLNKKARRRLQILKMPYPKSANDGKPMKKIKVDLSDCDTTKL